MNLNLNTTCVVRRPFGGAIFASNVPCRLVSNMRAGRAPTGAGNLLYSDYLIVTGSTDIRDGCQRAVGGQAETYADGDEIRIPNDAGSVYVVVWVENFKIKSATYKKVYLLRDLPQWPGP